MASDLTRLIRQPNRRSLWLALVAVVLLPGAPEVFAASAGNHLAITNDLGTGLVLAELAPPKENPVEQVHEMTRKARILKERGDYLHAALLWERILPINESLLGREHLETAQSLNNLASLYASQGRYEDAENLFRRALAIREKVLGPEHPDVATSLNNLAMLNQKQGRYEEAESLFQRAMENRNKILGPDHPDMATSLNGLATLFRRQGRYGEAERLFKRALAIREKALGIEHRETATSLNDLGILYLNQARLIEAEPLLRRALAIYANPLAGAEDSYQLATLNSLAQLYADQGREEEAEYFYLQSLLICKKVLGLGHPDVATILTGLAVLYCNQDRYEEAAPLLGRALAIRKKSLGPRHPDLMASLGNLATLLARQGDLMDAELLYRNALETAKEDLVPRRFFSSPILRNLAQIYIVQGRPVVALSLLARLARAQVSWLQRELPLQPRELRMAQLQSQQGAITTTFALLHKDSSTAPFALETRLNRQGLLSDIEQRQQQLAASSPPTRDLAERIAGLDRQLASVSLPSERRPVLRQERQQLEAELFRALPNLRLEAVTVHQVAAALKALAPDGVLVEFQKYQPLLRDAGKGKPGWGSPRYVALLLRPDGRVSNMQLGEAKPIEAAIAQALQASANNNGDALELLGRVGTLLFKPLQSQLGGVRQLFLSPDSELNRVPFAALPVPGQSKQLLGEVLQLRVLTTGRDLLRLQQSLPASGPAALIANPDYDRKDGVPATTDAANSIASLDIPTSSGVRSQQRSSDLDGSKPWKPLPATAQEAKLLAPLLQVTQPISGSQATVTRTLQLKAPRILHIATHGFFEADQQAAAKDAGPFRSLADRQDPGAGRQEDPLLRSGLVLAGANHPQADPKDDGYLTAAEATGLQLEGTELVTLSACETGLGALRSGEGVYGLQRALTVAGARSTLLSLWKVNDDATAEFMVRFYKRLKAGEGRAEALVATQKEFRDGLPGHPDWMQPYYWAAWQLVGDWRPMARP